MDTLPDMGEVPTAEEWSFHVEGPANRESAGAGEHVNGDYNAGEVQLDGWARPNAKLAFEEEDIELADDR